MKNIIKNIIATLLFLSLEIGVLQGQNLDNKEPKKEDVSKEAITINQAIENKEPTKIADSKNTPTTEQLDASKLQESLENKQQKSEEKIEPIKNSKDKDVKELIDKKYESLMLTEIELKNIKKANEAANSGQPFVAEVEEEPKIKGSKEEQEKVKEKKKKEQEEKLKKEEEEQGSEKSYIYLASIIYFNQKDWVIWLNDQKITPKTNQKNKELYIKKVYENQIDVVWKLSITKWKIISGKKSETIAPKINKDNQIEVYFTLKPNQTFMLSNNSVVEGKAVINLIKKKEKQNAISSLLNEMKGEKKESKKEDNKEIKKDSDFFNSPDML